MKKSTIIWIAVVIIVIGLAVYLFNTIDLMETFKKFHGS